MSPPSFFLAFDGSAEGVPEGKSTTDRQRRRSPAPGRWDFRNTPANAGKIRHEGYLITLI